MIARSIKGNAFWVYMIIAAGVAFGQGTIFTVSMIYQVETVKLSPLQLVLVGTTLETTCFLSQIPTGVLADVYSRRLSVVIGYLLTGAGFLVEGLIPHFAAILIGMVLWGIGASCVDGAEEAWITGEIGDERAGVVFTRATQVRQIAGLIAMPFGILLGSVRLNLAIIVGASIMLLLGIVLILIMPEEHFQAAPVEERNSWKSMARQVVEGSRAISGSRMLVCIFGVMLVLGLYSEGYDRLSTAHFLKDLVFPTLWSLKPIVWFGVMGVCGTLLTLVVTEVVKRTVDTNKPRVLIGAQFALNMGLMACVAIFALTGNFYLAAGVDLLGGAFRTASWPLYGTWLTHNSDPKVRATLFSVSGQMNAVGQIAGGPGVGYIGERFSIRVALMVASLMMSPIIYFYLRALRLSKATVPVPEEVVNTTSQTV